GEFDIHIAFDLAPPGGIDEFLGGLGDDRIAVIVQPIEQRANRGIFLVFDQSCIVEATNEIAATLIFFQHLSIIDVQAKTLGGPVSLCSRSTAVECRSKDSR